MKKLFFDQMLQVMRENKDVYFLFGGLGYPRVDEFLKEFPDRAINTEASEQTALDIAVGLAYSEKLAVVYTISSFYWRAAETIRTYLNHEDLPCVLIGAGVAEEYGHEDGFSHSATDMPELFNIFKNFNQWYPDDKKQLEHYINISINNKEPNFINIHR